MGYYVNLNFALIFACVATGYGCESDTDCPKTTKYENRCCRNSTRNSKLSCHKASSCLCEADNECGQLCCSFNKCTKCPKCVSGSDCAERKVCCGRKYGQCRNSCLGSLCRVTEECANSRLCCISKTCVDTGCKHAHPNVAVYVVVGFIMLFILVLVRFKFKWRSRQRRRVAPVNLEMNATVLTMPTTYLCTNSSDRKNRTTSSSQKG